MNRSSNNPSLKLKCLLALLLVVFFNYFVLGQSCTGDASGGGSVTFYASTISWAPSGGGSCPPSTTFTGDVVINIGGSDTFIWDYDLDMTGDMIIAMENSSLMEMDADINITGNIPLTNTGSNAILKIDTLRTVHVIAGTNGDVGDAANNNVAFEIRGTMIVDGTVSGNNNNGFDGNGTLEAGSLDFNGEPECKDANGCPIIIVSGDCSPEGSDFCNNDVTLPIVLGDYSVLADKDHVTLNWTTVSEENNDYFTIERSTDGLIYNSIGMIKGAGNSLKKLTYIFTDQRPLFGKSYYRLKQTDFDGRSEFFKPLVIEFTTLEEGKLTFSNPTRIGDAIKLYTGANIDEELNFTIHNMLGEQIMEDTFKGDEFIFKINDSVAPGTYVASVSSKNVTRIGRLVIR